MTVRVRFAPSPTGMLHVGNARAALYNYLFARGLGGVFVLRGDDTDQERSSAEFRKDILDGLHWLGLDWDEGIDVGGPHEPYYQSQRFDRYREVAESLVAVDKAYYCFVDPEQMEAFRREARVVGRAPAYDGRFRTSAAESARRVGGGELAPIRFAIPRPGETSFRDLVRGEVVFEHGQIDDFIILRSDGSPTYHLASTVDDVDFAITHVVRGEDLLSSTPKHILLTRAMGSESPLYAHLSLLLGTDGKKLSKRHGDTSLRTYRLGGYLPDAVVNYLALLGWSPGEDETIVSLDEMVARFELEGVTKNPSTFDSEKLIWMNGVYIRSLTDKDFVAHSRLLVEEALGRQLNEQEFAQLERISPLLKERSRLLTDIPEQISFLFGDVEYDQVSWDKVMVTPEAAVIVQAARLVLESLSEWCADAIEEVLRAMLEERDLSARVGLQPLRVAVTGSSVSPPLFESLAVLGRELSLARLDTAKSLIDR